MEAAFIFDNFSKSAIDVIELARGEAQRLGLETLEPEHLLLGVLHKGATPTSKQLRAQGITILIARAEVEKIYGRGRGSNAPLSHRSEVVLELALIEANGNGEAKASPEDIFVTLCREDPSTLSLLCRLGFVPDTEEC